MAWSSFADSTILYLGSPLFKSVRQQIYVSPSNLSLLLSQTSKGMKMRTEGTRGTPEMNKIILPCHLQLQPLVKMSRKERRSRGPLQCPRPRRPRCRTRARRSPPSSPTRPSSSGSNESDFPYSQRSDKYIFFVRQSHGYT